MLDLDILIILYWKRRRRDVWLNREVKDLRGMNKEELLIDIS
jgi:hypothetical protein